MVLMAYYDVYHWFSINNSTIFGDRPLVPAPCRPGVLGDQSSCSASTCVRRRRRVRSVCRPSGEKFPGTTSIEARGAAGALLGAKKGLRKAKKAGMSAEMLEEFRIQDVIFNIYICGSKSGQFSYAGCQQFVLTWDFPPIVAQNQAIKLTNRQLHVLYV